MKQFLGKALLLTLISFLLYKSCVGFQEIAWGTGVWRGEFSRTWALLYFGFILFCVAFFATVVLYIWKGEFLQIVIGYMISLRHRLGRGRWLVASLILIFPVLFLQYTPWGVVFHDTYIRLLIWFLVVMAFAFCLKEGSVLFGWKEFLIAVLVTSSEFVIIVSFIGVTNYPFSLGWSEGNRLWDYSVLFGRHLYDYPADKEIPVFLDMGRRLVGGLPFLIPGLTIGMERFWIGLTVILPYLFLGFAAFRSARKSWAVYVLTGLWSLILLKQGPIHPPLVLLAVVVALVWRSPLWWAISLIAVAGYAAGQSRYTWLFAPGMWIGMLELAGAELHQGKLSLNSWIRALSLGLVGMAGGVFGPKVAGLLAGNAASAPTTAVTVTSVSTAAAVQPLLWYRLFPNATYGVGILVGLLIAILPLVTVLSYLAATKKWRLNIWQVLAIISPLLAFLVVGLIASTKIGGGGDLHNMDMFLIGLMFAGVIAWEKGGREWFLNIDLSPFVLKLTLLLMFALPGIQSLKDMRPYNFAEDTAWLATLTDAPAGDDLSMYPSKEITNEALDTIRQKVALVRSQDGEILFMDQRQLLTFGFVRDVPLVPEYEKKLIMNQALSSDAAFFKAYYADLATKRFGLIISEPLRQPVKDSSYQFGEENNAWVKWVSIPTLCYYEPKITLKEVGVQLLFPRTDTSGCSSVLPEGSVP